MQNMDTDEFTKDDPFGDSVTVQFIGGPYDGEEVIQGNISPRICLDEGYYQWRAGQYHWEVKP
jgi:hypothetical protein